MPRLRLHHIRIVDDEKLRGVLEELSERYESGRKTAAWLGIGPWTFSRLRNGATTRAMSHDTYAAICWAFDADPDAPRRRLDRPIPDPLVDDGDARWKALQAKARDPQIRERELNFDDLDAIVQSVPTDVVISPDELEEGRRSLMQERSRRAQTDYSLLAEVPGQHPYGGRA